MTRTEKYISLITWYCFIAGCAILSTIWACSTPARNAQMRIADAVSRAANETAPALTDLYKADLAACLGDAGTRIEYMTCSTQVESDWTRARLAWDHLRRVQNEYATALEKHDVAVTDYIQWIQMAYCEMQSVAPAGVKAKLPTVEGLRCDR